MKYKYNDKVKVIGGFYEGLEGVCIRCIDGFGLLSFPEYRIRFEKENIEVWIKQYYLELLNLQIKMNKLEIIRIQKESIEEIKEKLSIVNNGHERVYNKLCEDLKEKVKEVEYYEIQHKTDMFIINDLLEDNHNLENELVKLRIQLKDKESRKRYLYL